MTLISDKYQNEKLNKLNINIKTKFIVGDKILERNSNNTYNDNIDKGIIALKEYYLNNKLIYTERCFDSRMEYSFISDDLDDTYICPNCSATYKISDNNYNCPYCGTYYNIDYTDKELGNKYHYDRVLRSNKYRVITGIVDIIFSLIISFIFIKYTSRTFNVYDISNFIKEFSYEYSDINENNLFFTTSYLRDYHYLKQKNNAYYHIQAINLPFQNIEFYYIKEEI